MRNWWLNKIKFLIPAIVLLGAFLVFNYSEAVSLPNKYPRLANIYYDSDISTEEAEDLAQWDILVIGVELQHENPGFFETVRSINPDIIILAYIASEEIPTHYAEITDTTHPHYILQQGLSENWYLKNTSGEKLSNWPGTYLMNASSNCPAVSGETWNTYLADFMADEVISTRLWDGIFYDNVWNDISWANDDIDIDLDGNAETSSEIDTAWRAGMENLLAASRNLIGDDYIIIGNGGGSYYTYLNGRLIEDFPSEYDGDWPGATQKYFDVMDQGKNPPLVIINSMGNQTDYQRFRYTVASSLLDNGFFSYDYSITNHAQLWWYDEYNVALGEPTNQAYNTLNSSNPYTVQPGVWRRDFEQGIVLVNSTSSSREIELGGPYEKIRGTQDPETNDGEVVTSVTLESEDGLILLNRLSDVNGVVFQNGGYAKVFDNQGVETRNPFYSYDADYPGGTQIVNYDINADGRTETVLADDTRVWVYDYQNQLQFTFCPYNCTYSSGVNIAVGDLNKDGKAEIVTGTKMGGGPHVRIFNHTGKLIRPGFFAYAKHFRGGAQVNIADLDGDGFYEIVVGAGFGGGPHVRIFDRYGNLINPGFFAYDPKFRGGVNIAVGDLNNDGNFEIVTGAGPGGGPHVRIFDKDGKLLSAGFFAYDNSYRGGVRVQVVDIDGNGSKEILTMTQ